MSLTINRVTDKTIELGILLAEKNQLVTAVNKSIYDIQQRSSEKFLKEFVDFFKDLRKFGFRVTHDEGTYIAIAEYDQQTVEIQLSLRKNDNDRIYIVLRGAINYLIDCVVRECPPASKKDYRKPEYLDFYHSSIQNGIGTNSDDIRIIDLDSRITRVCKEIKNLKTELCSPESIKFNICPETVYLSSQSPKTSIQDKMIEDDSFSENFIDKKSLERSIESKEIKLCETIPNLACTDNLTFWLKRIFIGPFSDSVKKTESRKS